MQCSLVMLCMTLIRYVYTVLQRHLVASIFVNTCGKLVHALLGQVAKVGAKPSLVSVYAKVAALTFEPAGELTGEVSYETSLAQVQCTGFAIVCYFLRCSDIGVESCYCLC